MDIDVNYQSNILANLIYFFHIFIILCVILLPFSGIPALLILHIVGSISLFVHWYGNSDACSLTILESKLRGLDNTDTFTHKFISPIYKISNTDMSSICWFITFIAMSISIYNLYNSKKFKIVMDNYNKTSDKSWNNTFKLFQPLFIL